jgi:choline dehydrogenase-like flavoprotein
MKDRFDVVVVGSGAGGGVVAGELARRGRDVLLLEAGAHYTAADFTRWEAKANHTLFAPIRFADVADGPPVALLSGRCVGGTTVINTKVALRATDHDLAKWHEATGLTNDGGEAFGAHDLAPYYERVETQLGVRERNDWTKSVYTVKRGFDALGAELESVHAYADVNCMRCGSCLQGCPTNAGKSTQNTYIHETWVPGLLDLRANANVDRVVVDGGEATGVEYVDADKARHTVGAGAVVVAGGALDTPQLLQRSGLASPALGRNLGLHPVRLVYGLFDEPQDNHMAYPITTHCMEHQHDENGGFVIEATTIQDPIAFATTLCNENGSLWGQELVDAVKQYRNYVGVLAMVNDENNATVDDGDRFAVAFNEREQTRIERALQFSRDVLAAAGAKRILWSGLASTHWQGSARMGDDPARSVVDRNCETHEVKRLYVGDGSLVPRTLSVNPSLTIMALATRLADRLSA